MKPDWKDAPSWANYLTMDEDGTWWWHELKPNLRKGFIVDEWESDGMVEAASTTYEQSLEKRPK